MRHLRYAGYVFYTIVLAIVILGLSYTLTHTPNVDIDLKPSISADGKTIYSANVLNKATIEQNVIVRLNAEYGTIKSCKLSPDSYNECELSYNPAQAVMDCDKLPDYIFKGSAISIAGFDCEITNPDILILKYDSSHVHIEKEYRNFDPVTLECNNKTTKVNYVDILKMVQDSIMPLK